MNRIHSFDSKLWAQRAQLHLLHLQAPIILYIQIFSLYSRIQGNNRVKALHLNDIERVNYRLSHQTPTQRVTTGNADPGSYMLFQVNSWTVRSSSARKINAWDVSRRHGHLYYVAYADAKKNLPHMSNRVTLWTRQLAVSSVHTLTRWVKHFYAVGNSSGASDLATLATIQFTWASLQLSVEVGKEHLKTASTRTTAVL